MRIGSRVIPSIDVIIAGVDPTAILIIPLLPKSTENPRFLNYSGTSQVIRSFSSYSGTETRYNIQSREKGGYHEFLYTLGLLATPGFRPLNLDLQEAAASLPGGWWR